MLYPAEFLVFLRKITLDRVLIICNNPRNETVHGNQPYKALQLKPTGQISSGGVFASSRNVFY